MSLVPFCWANAAPAEQNSKNAESKNTYVYI